VVIFFSPILAECPNSAILERKWYTVTSACHLEVKACWSTVNGFLFNRVAGVATLLRAFNLLPCFHFDSINSMEQKHVTTHQEQLSKGSSYLSTKNCSLWVIYML